MADTPTTVTPDHVTPDDLTPNHVTPDDVTARRWFRVPHRVAAVLAVLVPTGATALHALTYGRWIVDDAGITFAYARSITSGHGPVLQPGAAPVEGYSDPAWLGVLMVGRWLGLFDHGAWFGVPDYVLFPKGVALLCCAVVFFAGYRATAAVCRRPALVATLAGLVVAATPSFVIWSFSGLENSLLAAATVGLAAVLVTAAANGRLLTVRTALWCGLLAALAALTRPEGLVYAAAYPVVAVLWVTRATLRRTVWTVPLSLVGFAVPAGGYLAWRLAEFHSVVSNTTVAKSQTPPTVSDLSKAADLAGYAGWPIVLVAVVCVGTALARPSRARTGLVALLVPLLLAVLAYAVLVQDWMGEYRFATPIWPLAAYATAISMAQVLPHLAVRGRATLTVLTALACVVTGVGWQQDAARFRVGPTLPVCVVAAQAREYDGYARLLGLRDATVLLPDIGGTALVTHLRVVDLAGLADARIAEYWAHSDMDGLRNYVFTSLRPTIIHAHGAWSKATGLLPTDPRTIAAYYVVRRTPGGGANLIRRDVVPDQRTLAALRAFAAKAAGPEAAAAYARRSSCGPTLRPDDS